MGGEWWGGSGDQEESGVRGKREGEVVYLGGKESLLSPFV